MLKTLLNTGTICFEQIAGDGVCMSQNPHSPQRSTPNTAPVRKLIMRYSFTATARAISVRFELAKQQHRVRERLNETMPL